MDVPTEAKLPPTLHLRATNFPQGKKRIYSIKSFKDMRTFKIYSLKMVLKGFRRLMEIYERKFQNMCPMLRTGCP